MKLSEQRRKKIKIILIIALVLSLLVNAKQGFMDGWNAGRAKQQVK